MTEVLFALGNRKVCARPVLLVDEHGCLLHDEPVCWVDDDSRGALFFAWLEKQDVPDELRPLTPLLYHPALGEGPPEPTRNESLIDRHMS